MLIAIFAVALEEGMTIGELSRNYGCSRQTAARYAKGALAAGDPAPADAPIRAHGAARQGLGATETVTAVEVVPFAMSTWVAPGVEVTRAPVTRRQ